eukprot:TRINITY_DN4369_c0_g1_i1.p1 TRINITY_DN4369_c0_g1~~TRINITY_DN4369_c0_g1_i1.p1  ORF type:complete len:1113 (-),score=357.69 TRINITY_DN4369_c0_g1_i1:72-3410(-)
MAESGKESGLVERYIEILENSGSDVKTSLVAVQALSDVFNEASADGRLPGALVQVIERHWEDFSEEAAQLRKSSLKLLAVLCLSSERIFSNTLQEVGEHLSNDEPHLTSWLRELVKPKRTVGEKTAVLQLINALLRAVEHERDSLVEEDDDSDIGDDEFQDPDSDIESPSIEAQGEIVDNTNAPTTPNVTATSAAVDSLLESSGVPTNQDESSSDYRVEDIVEYFHINSYINQLKPDPSPTPSPEANNLRMMIDIYDTILERAQNQTDQDAFAIYGEKGALVAEAFEDALFEVIHTAEIDDLDEREIADQTCQLLLSRLNDEFGYSDDETDTEGTESIIPPPPPPGASDPPSAGVPDAPPPGAAAPPPPPPGAPGDAIPGLKKEEPAMRPTKAQPQLPRKLKPLQWARLKDNDTVGTIWGPSEAGRQGVSDDAIQFSEHDIQELTSLFGVPDAKPMATVAEHKAESNLEEPEITAEEKSAPAVVKKEPVRVLEPKRAQNVDIVLKRRFRNVPIPQLVNEVKNAKLTGNTSRVLTPENIHSLITLLPNEDDKTAVLSIADQYFNNTDPTFTVGIPEQFMLEMNRIPRVERKLEVLLFTTEFNSKYSEIKGLLKTINSTIKRVYRSESWKQLMAVVLKLGNLLNAGSSRGGAYGFKIGSLLKLSEVKPTHNFKVKEENGPNVVAGSETAAAVEGSAADAEPRVVPEIEVPTLVHYLALKMDKNDNDWSRGLDLSILKRELRVFQGVEGSASNVAADYQEIQKGAQLIKSEIAASEHSEDAVDKQEYADLQAWSNSGSSELSKLEAKYQEVKQNEIEILKYFGEVSQNTTEMNDLELGKKIDELFGTIYNVIEMFESARKDNEEKLRLKREAEAREERRKRMKENLSNKTARPRHHEVVLPTRPLPAPPVPPRPEEAEVAAANQGDVNLLLNQMDTGEAFRRRDEWSHLREKSLSRLILGEKHGVEVKESDGRVHEPVAGETDDTSVSVTTKKKRRSHKHGEKKSHHKHGERKLKRSNSSTENMMAGVSKSGLSEEERRLHQRRSSTSERGAAPVSVLQPSASTIGSGNEHHRRARKMGFLERMKESFGLRKKPITPVGRRSTPSKRRPMEVSIH